MSFNPDSTTIARKFYFLERKRILSSRSFLEGMGCQLFTLSKRSPSDSGLKIKVLSIFERNNFHHKLLHCICANLSLQFPRHLLHHIQITVKLYTISQNEYCTDTLESILQNTTFAITGAVRSTSKNLIKNLAYNIGLIEAVCEC